MAINRPKLDKAILILKFVLSRSTTSVPASNVFPQPCKVERKK